MTNSSEKSQSKTKKISAKSAEALQDFLKLMDEEHLDELEISDGPFQVKLVRQPKVLAASPIPSHLAQPHRKSGKKSGEEEPGHKVKSPLAGVFYRAPSPQAPVFINEGDAVTPEKKLCIIEAMKVMNEITAGVKGRLLKILVENGQPVQADQPLFVIEPLE